jgi:hypothetical protein
MTKELDFLEINLSRAIPEGPLLDEVSQLLQVDRATFWNWNWPEEAPEQLLVNVSYVVDDEPAYPLLLSLSFNRPLAVPLGFEVELGYALARHFDCAVLVSDPSDSADGLLQIQPTGDVAACVLGEDSQGRPSYRLVAGLSGPYHQVISQLRELAP